MANTLQLTWQNVLLDRLTNTPVSVQMEVWPSGRFTYRYDLSRLDVDEVTNVLVGACLGDLEWATNSIPTNLTSLAFYPLSPEDAANGDRDGDGLSLLDELFAFGTDPDLRDSSGDGISDGEAVSLGLDPLLRHVSDADILARVASSATNEAFLAGNVVSTNVLAAWALLDGFAADWPSGATNVLWERSFDVERTSAWQQYFVSASPSNAAPWCLDGLLLEWAVDGETRGSLAVSPAGDSWRVPLAPDEFPTNITLRLRATGAGGVRCPTPLHLAAYAPDFRVDGGQVVTGQSGKRFFVFTEGSDSEMLLVVDHARRPHRAPPGADECDMAQLSDFEMQTGGLSFDGNASGGVVAAWRPGIYGLPDVPLGIAGAAGVSSGGNRSVRGGGGGSVVVLAPSAGWTCSGHGCGYDGLGYDWGDDGYYEEEYYPLDSKCLRKKWYHDWGGGWSHDGCEFWVSSGVGDDDGYVTTSADGGSGKVYVDGVEVWSGSAEHTYDDYGCGGGYHEDYLGDGCDSCDDDDDNDCANGNCDSLEGASLSSLKFRIPLGAPVKGQVAGFVWFSTDVPTNISKSTFQLLAHPDASVTDATENGTRRIACSDSRGRDLRIADIENGVRVTIYDTAAQTLEHTWEIVNVDGSASHVRLKKISRLDNVMSDETFSYIDGDWVRFDNVSQIGTRLTVSGDFSAWGDGVVTETRTTYDMAGGTLGTVSTEKRRVGECDNAVVRETYRSESTGWNWKWSRADYWNDPSHSARHGQPRLVWGNARAWTYTDYDEFGHETLRVEQRGSAAVPEEFPYVVSNVLYDASTLANAFVTVRDFEPLSGDSRHRDDAARPRAETRYVVTNGVATLVARTLTRYTRLTRDGYAAIKKETWRGGSTSSATDAYSYEITYASTGDGTPLLMRDAVAESLDENGILTVNAYALDGNALTCTTRRYGPNHEPQTTNHEFPTYEVVVRNASYGTVLRDTVRLTDGDAVIADEQSIYDDQNRLRSTTFLDGTSLTNAYSCCRLLWKRDREGRKVLRSARTGTDHLYNAMEDVWLADVSTNGQYRVTQHFYDALGRETNRVVYAGSAPGEATVASASDGKAYTTVTTTYPYGGDDYAVSTDERGRVTIRRVDILADCIETGETVFTNGVEVVKTKSRSYFGGGSSMRREWGGDNWTEERRFTDYAADGSRIDYVVTESSDCGVVTNSVSTYDLLGRLVTSAVPAGATGVSPAAGWNVTSNAYDGATSRTLTATFAAGDVVRTTHYIYNDIGEQVGTILDGVSNRTDVTYECVSNEWWEVTANSVIGPSTNTCTITRTQLTGLSDFCRRHSVTQTGRAAVLAATGATDLSPDEVSTSETLVTYDPATGIETETSVSSVSSTAVSRSRHGILLSTEAPGQTTASFYDAFARVAATSRAIGDAAPLPLQSFAYTPAGDRLATHTYTNGTDDIVETYAYDMLGNRIVSTDALGNTVFRAYDPFGQITAEWGATYPVRYTYDTQGRRTSLSTTRDGTAWDTTAWAYDPVTGNCISKTYADGSTVSYTYTPDNLPLRTTYASHKWKEKVYDAQRRLCGVIYSSSDMDYELQLDLYGNATNVQDAAENTWRHVFGLNSILLGEEYVSMGEVQFSASAVTNSLSRIVDPFDRPAGFAFSVNGTAKCGIGYDYDCDGHVAHYVATNSAGRTFAVVYTNVAGYCCGYTLTTPSGGTLRRAVDRDDCRRSLVTNCATYFNSSLVDSNLYAFDALSRPTTRTTGVTGISSVDSTFSYNNRSEVVSAAIGTNFFAHAYDDIGNHLLFGDNAVTNTYTHNNLNQIATSRCALASPRTIHHNADGDLSSDGIWTYAYDAEDQLTSVTSRSLTNGAIRVRNAYDYRRRRISKTVQRLNVTTALPPSPPVELREWETLEMRTFVYDDWNLIHETVYTVEGGVTNVTEIQYFWCLDLSGTLQGAGGVGGLLAVSRNGQLYFPTFDNNGNVTKYIDESGNVVAAYEYDDFGRTISQSGPLADFFRHRFSTKYYDPETGLYYYGHRFYNPVLLRWLNRDPIEEDGGANLYCFVQNASIFAYDALGQRRSNLPGIIMDALCEDAYNFAKRFLNTSQEFRAWDRYTNHGWRGRNRDIELSAAEVQSIAESINEVVSHVQARRGACKKGVSFSDLNSIGGAAPEPWIKALGGVSIEVSTSCNNGCFSYGYSINDLYDFDTKGLSGFKSRGWAGQLGTIGVNWTETCLKCDWQTFYHKGVYSSK